jgi:hypothetical protein
MIRFKAGDPKGVPSGYEGVMSPTDIVIPSCGLEDLERALFDMFDKELSFEVTQPKTSSMKKVPVLFSSGEKWAMLKGNRGIRDKTDSVILPLISITRTSIEQDVTNDITGRGINHQTAEILIKRQLSSADREYQNLINKLYIKNQLNVAVGHDEAITGQLSTKREIGSLSNDPDVIKGGLMISDRLKNVWEVITLPSPQFYTAKYSIIFWTQYQSHMNEMIEKFFSSLLTPGNCLKLETPKGYWFIATLDGGTFEPDTNFSDQAGQERLIKYKFSMSVQGYFFATNIPGVPVPAKRVISCPTVSFAVENAFEMTSEESTQEDPWLGADDPTLPSEVGEQKYRRDQRAVPILFPRTDRIDGGDAAKRVDANGRPYSGRGKYVKRKVLDVKTGKIVESLVRLVSRNSQGEEVYTGVLDTTGLSIDVFNKS